MFIFICVVPCMQYIREYVRFNFVLIYTILCIFVLFVNLKIGPITFAEIPLMEKKVPRHSDPIVVFILKIFSLGSTWLIAVCRLCVWIIMDLLFQQVFRFSFLFFFSFFLFGFLFGLFKFRTLCTTMLLTLYWSRF